MKRYVLLAVILILVAAPGALAQPPKGMALPGGLLLNGKFDLAYERVGYSGNLADGKNALTNYHHFLFLSRENQSDPFFFTTELVDLTFYEFGARFQERYNPLTYGFRAGKLIVPFGGEPIFHHTYGGLSGFDQKILPTIWSQHGAAAQVQYSGEGWSISNDTYVVQGYALPEEDAVLSLQADFSESDDVKPSYGNRLGFGYGPLTIWYSTMGNPLGFGRLLFMQAIDASLWRPDFPVADMFTLSAGIFRADVSGGGAEKDYYHFGDYAQLRFYPMSGVYLEARTGLRTTNNRNASYIDDRRLDENDQSAHSLGVAYRTGGFMFKLQHVWIYEKMNEKDNDFLRLRAGYEF